MRYYLSVSLNNWQPLLCIRCEIPDATDTPDKIRFKYPDFGNAQGQRIRVFIDHPQGWRMKKQFALVSDTVRQNALSHIRSLEVNPSHPIIIEAREETRTDRQNRLMWPLLKDLSEQVIWHGEKLTREEWKDVITVLVNQVNSEEQRSVPGINGGRVYFGVRTSKSSKRYMVDVIEAIYWFGTERGVTFSEKSQVRFEWAKRWGGFAA